MNKKTLVEWCRGIAASVAAMTMLAGNANAGIIGSVDGPDSSFDIDFRFYNALSVSPFANVLSLSLNGGTAYAGNIIWDSVGTLGGSASPSSVSGVNTNLVTFTFANGEFGIFDTFIMNNVDPDFSPGPAGVSVGQLAGVSVSALFSNQTRFNGVFVDDPRRFQGLDLEGSVTSVPEPATLVLLGLGLAGLGFAGRRKA